MARSLSSNPLIQAVVNSKATTAEELFVEQHEASEARFSALAQYLPLAAMPQLAPVPEVITLYDSDCTTPKTEFQLGDVVCAKATGIPLGASRRFAWLDPSGFIERTEPILADGQTDSWTNPSTSAGLIAGVFVVENRGTWRANIINSRGAVRASAFYSVKDSNPLTIVSDLTVNLIALGEDSPVTGSQVQYSLKITNQGPQDATDVHVIDEDFVNATLDSVTQTGGLGNAFTCTSSGSVDCEIATLPAGASAEFLLNFTAGAAGSTIDNKARAESTTAELNETDNESMAAPLRISTGGAPPSCVLECPSNISVVANTTQGAQSGAIVTYPSAEGFGSCGTISTATGSPASGSFFPVGSTVVAMESSQGGGSCSFTVTVHDQPLITCAADLTATVTGTQTSATVPLTPPTSPVSGVTVIGSRSDVTCVPEPGNDCDAVLNGPFPVGITIITWTATATDGRSESCQQRVIVTSDTVPTISCPSDKTFTAADCDGTTLTSGQIGTPTTTGNGVTVTTRRSDDRAMTDPFPVGQTVITWTATDNIDRIVSCTQTITVTSGNDTTPPTLVVPPDVSVTTNSCSALLDDELGAASADDGCSTVTLTRTGVPSVACPTPSNPTRMCETFIFPAGETIITYTATDGNGNQTVGTQKVTVTEPTPPTITAPADVTLYTGPGATACGLTISDLNAALGTATANDNCSGVTWARSNVPGGNLFPVGDTVITYTATDASGNTAFDTQTVTVVDNTVPTITAPANVTLYTGLGATTCDVTVVNLDGTLGVPTADDNCPGVTWARGNVPAGNVFPLGDTFVTYTATDAKGNTSAPVTQKVTVIDNTPPVVTPPPDITVYLPLHTPDVSRTVTYPVPATATDNCAGTITFNYSPASGSVFPVGPTTVTVTATDAHNNSAQATFTVTVLYVFTGFFQPVDNLPTLNQVNAGRAIPVKFSLSGNKGLNIFAVGSPSSGTIPCGANDPIVDIEETVTAGSSSLSYSASNEQYNYVWKTENSWAGTCRQLVVQLNDGSIHRANFKFK